MASKISITGRGLSGRIGNEAEIGTFGERRAFAALIDGSDGTGLAFDRFHSMAQEMPRTAADSWFWSGGLAFGHDAAFEPSLTWHAEGFSFGTPESSHVSVLSPIGGAATPGLGDFSATGVIEASLVDDIHAHFDALRTSSGGTLLSAKSGGSGGTLSTYTSVVTGSDYNVTINFKGTWTTDLQTAFKGSADRISHLITGDVPNVIYNGVRVDDIVISAELKAIDGVGNVLGQAGPTSIRTGSYLPATAIMQFDSADATNYLGLGLWDEIVTHEMLHCVGIGSIWGYKGLVTNNGFTGTNAVSQYDALVDAYSASHGGSTTLANGVTLSKGAVPVETGGGSGTAGSHWAENVFNTELMTGYIDTVDPLSGVTAASLADLGYVTPATSTLLASGFVDPYALG